MEYCSSTQKMIAWNVSQKEVQVTETSQAG